MKRIFILISFSLLTSAFAIAQTLESKTYPNGIYIFCGKDIPRNFYYLIEKKNASGSWDTAAELRAPQNAAELKANMLRLPDFFTSTMPLPVEHADDFWEQLSPSSSTDALLLYSSDPIVLAAVGCGWFDDGITAAGEYHYRVSKKYRTDSIALGETSRRFPENNYKETLNAVRIEPEDSHVTLYYRMSNPAFIGDVILYQSRLFENDYRITPTITTYTLLDGEMVAMVRDESVAKGVAYNYVAIPRDKLGNKGTPSDTIQVYNLRNLADIGIINSFKAVGDKDKRGIMLNWEMTSDFNIHSYEIFRSKDFDSGYQSLVTLPASDSSYLDTYDINFSEIYFYYIVVSNGYGKNIPSAPTPALLEGTEMNNLPPQDLTAEVQDNVVHLSFTSAESDTWGYQVYRGEGYTGEMSKIASISVSQLPSADGNDNAMVVFTDTLENSYLPQTISYAVTDLNSSNNYSPLSQRVTIQYSGGMMPAPSNVEAQLRGDRILVLWNDAAKAHPYIGSYKLWRSEVKGETETEAQIVATLDYEQNNFIDTLIIPGTHYRYRVESVGLEGETSDRSLHAGIAVPQLLPLPPGQVSAIATDSRILLRWDNPLDPSIQSIRIYRATSTVEAALLKELPANQSTFEDQTAKQGEQYYYYVVTVNNRDEESKADVPVGGRIRR